MMQKLSIQQVRTVLAAADVAHHHQGDVVRFSVGNREQTDGLFVTLTVEGPELEMTARSLREAPAQRRADLLDAVNEANAAVHAPQATVVLLPNGALEIRYDQRLEITAAPTPLLASIVHGFVRNASAHMRLSFDLLTAGDGLDDALDELLEAADDQPPAD